MKKIIFTLIALPLLFSTSHINAALFTTGNLLITGDNQIHEYTTSGQLVQSIPVQSPVASHTTRTKYLRDIAVKGNDLYIYNGTFDPYLSIYDSQSSSWNHHTYSGWSTVNNGTYGGIDTIGKYVFVTDMRTFGDDGADEASGIVRFDISSGSAERFANGIEMIDLTVGHDGYLYGLFPGGHPGGRFLDVFDPFSLVHVNSISFADIFGHTGHRSIAVDAESNVFIADWDGDIHKIDSEGNILLSMNLCSELGGSNCSFYDIDIYLNGLIAIGEREGSVILTDNNFSFISTFETINPYYRGSFVEFVHGVPLPSVFFLFLLGMAELLILRCRRVG